MSRRLARELALRVLFQVDLVGGEPSQALADLLPETELSPEDAAFARDLVAGTLAHQAEVDAHIQRHARDWRLERLATVDRNILRLSIYQILHRPDIPVSVAINEAVELAKAYGEAESARFVNGILGQIARERQGEPAQGGGSGDAGAPD